MNRSIILAFFVLLVGSVSAQAQTSYTVTDLGGIETVSDTTGAMAINDRGQVVGGDGRHAFLWESGKKHDLGALRPVPEEDINYSVAYSISNYGALVSSSGSFQAIFGSGLQLVRGVIAKGSSPHLRQLTNDDLSFFPYAINDAAQIVGLNSYRDFFSAAGKLIELGTLSKVPAGNFSLAHGINQAGQVAGWSTAGHLRVAKFGQLATHAFMWQRHGKGGRMRDLSTPPDGSAAMPTASMTGLKLSARSAMRAATIAGLSGQAARRRFYGAKAR